MRWIEYREGWGARFFRARLAWKRRPSWVRWVLRVLAAIAVGVVGFLLATEAFWDKALALAEDETRRPYFIAIAAGAGVLLWPVFRHLSRGAVALASGLAAFLGAVFVVLPNLGPATVDNFEFANFRIERGVPLIEYGEHYPVKSFLGEEGWEIPRAELNQLGTVVLFDSDVKGRADESIDIRWTLFDAMTMKRVDESESIDPLCVYRGIESGPCVTRTPKRRDSDIAGFEFWVDTSDYGGDCFFIRLEAQSAGTRLTAADSPVFPGEGLPASPCEALSE